MPAGLAGVALQVVDRPIIKALTNDATLGIYQANYRLGIFMMLVVGMFDYAWRPFFLNHANEPDARKMFAKVLTYLSLILMSVFLIVSVFVEDIVRIRVSGRFFIHPDYWPGLLIVPWTLLAYVFTGLYTVFVPGVYLEKKTYYIPLNSGFGAALKVALNFALIPMLGLMGAAQATLWSYIAMAAGMYIVSHKYYRIEFEWGRIVRLTMLALGLYAVYTFLSLEPATVAGIAVKIGLMISYLVLLWSFRIIEPGEIRKLKAAMIGK
jgi:O-antigen/teichoic acid export membrane protein